MSNKYCFFIGILSFLSVISSCGSVIKSNGEMEGKSFLALGDSYSIGESVSESDRFPMQLVAELNKNGMSFQSPAIIARTGWRADQLITAIKQAELKQSYDLVTLLIGVNNEFQGDSSTKFEKEFTELCKTAIRLAGGKKSAVYVLSIPDYGYTPYGRTKQANISERINVYNEVVKSVSNSLGVQFIDITPISRNGLKETELVANDGLHPSGIMYSEWVKELLPLILIQD